MAIPPRIVASATKWCQLTGSDRIQAPQKNATTGNPGSPVAFARRSKTYIGFRAEEVCSVRHRAVPRSCRADNRIRVQLHDRTRESLSRTARPVIHPQCAKFEIREMMLFVKNQSRFECDG